MPKIFPNESVHHVRYLLRRLLALQEATGYEILQKQGQRIFGGPPPDWTGSPPGRGTEIYCYRIPRYLVTVLKRSNFTAV